MFMQTPLKVKYQTNRFLVGYAELIGKGIQQQPSKTVQQSLFKNSLVTTCIRKMGCNCPACNLVSPISYKQDDSAQGFVNKKLSDRVETIHQKNDIVSQFYSNLLLQYSITIKQTQLQERLLACASELLNSQFRLHVAQFFRSQMSTFLQLSLGHSDNMRWRALKIILDLVILYNSQSQLAKAIQKMPVEQIRLLSDKVYAQSYNLQSWYQPFKSQTPTTVFVEMTSLQIKALRDLCKKSNEFYFKYVNSIKSGMILLPDNWYQFISSKISLQPADQKIIAELIAKIDQAIIKEKMNESFFIKLSTRSPKDSQYIKYKLQKQLTNNQPHSEAIRLSNKMTNIVDAINCLITSQRVEQDLDMQISSSSTTYSNNISIVLRQFIDDIPPYAEFRGFICNFNLNAVSQYQDDKPYPWLIQNQTLIKETISQFYQSRIRDKLFDWGIPHAIIDFGLKIQHGQITDIILIEFNSFGVRSGSALYDWDNQNDYKTLLKGPYNLRILK